METVTSRPGTPAAQAPGATSQFVIFQVGATELAVPVEQVQEILVYNRVTKVPKLPEFIEGIIDVRGKIIPVLNLCKRFGIEGRPLDREARIVVAEVGEQTVGMIVDAVSEVLRVPLAAIEPPPPLITVVSPEFLAGIGKLESRILVILNLERLLSPDEHAELSQASSGLAQPHPEAAAAASA